MFGDSTTHLHHLRRALDEARKSPPTATAFCVGAVIISPVGKIISTGYTGELPGNTHAEQCAFEKLAPELPPLGSILYTTMEPCSFRLSGNKPCVDRILDLGEGRIKTVVVGVKEPGDFVEENTGEGKLRKNGIEYVYVPGLEKDILEVAKSGHPKETGEKATV
ncbi:hypothetical protein EX30DRAFT_339953 [Ascodesmis nigricans]|uniref:CMP/dCMP-type deaminase domain-containing protein n=1 Tax=Ascodesmis nigricans TaxID=341454 RepID=A0A4S2MZ29_9PEZI|nr:hypothetical protein EX30DRAFT_339953 [Ascodesmis nigricans]